MQIHLVDATYELFRAFYAPRPPVFGKDGVQTYEYNLAGNGKSHILETSGSIKVVRVNDGPVVGVHMIGARVGVLIGEAQLAVNWEALPSEVGRLIHAHPSLSEAIGETMITFSGRSLHG